MRHTQLKKLTLATTLFILSHLTNAQYNAVVTVPSGVTSGCSPVVVNFSGLNSTVPAGVTPYYFWDFGNGNTAFGTDRGTVSAAYATPGNYTVRLTVSAGPNTSPSHTTTFNTPITVFRNPTANFNVNGPTSGCAPLTINFNNLSQAGSVALANNNYRWDFGDGFSVSGIANPTHTYTATGNYNPVLIVTDNNGCVSTYNLNSPIRVGNRLSPSFTLQNGVACQVPHTVNFTNTTNTSGFAGPIDYFWDFGDGTTSTLVNPNKTYNSFGTYNVTLRAVDRSTGCEAITQSQQVRIINQQVGVTSNISQGCSPLPVRFNAQLNPSILGQQISWNFGAPGGTLSGNASESGIQNPSFTYNTAGNYTVTMSIQGPHSSCNRTVTTNVNVSQSPTNLSIQPSNINRCQVPTTINFTGSATNAASYRWTFQGGTPNSSNNQNQSVTYNSFGTFQVRMRAISSNGCADSITRTVNIRQPELSFWADRTQICTGQSVRFNFNANTFGDPITSWNWNFGDGNTSTQQNPNHTYNTPGQYNVTLTITTASGCTRTVTYTNYIRVTQRPVAGIAPFTPITSCNPRTVTYVNTSGVADRYEWLIINRNAVLPNGIVDRINQNNRQNLTYTYDYWPGDYGVALIAYNGGCSDTVVIPYTITILPPKAAFDFTVPQCENGPVQFTDRSSMPGIVSWNWNFGTGNPLDVSSQRNPVFTFPRSGSYNVTLTVVHENGCVDTETRTVTIPDIQTDLFNVDISNRSGCAPLTVNFRDNTPNVQSRLWTFGNGASSSNANVSTTYTEPGIYSVRLTIRTNNGCTISRTFDSEVTVFGTKASMDLCPPVGCAPLNLVAYDLSTSSTRIVSRTWNIGGTIISGNDSVISRTLMPSAGNQRNGIPISLTVSDAQGCSSTTSARVRPSIVRPDFTFTRKPTCDGDSVLFTAVNNDSTGIASFTYLWKFGILGTRTTSNPRLLFPDGTYNVTLIVTDANGCRDSLTKVLNTISGLPVANFCAKNALLPSPPCTFDSIVATCPPQPVDFQDLSTRGRAPIVSYRWSFGDGSLSTLQNPSRSYAQVGNFDVTLTITDSLGCQSTKVLEDFVRIKGPSATFSTTSLTLCTGTEVQFTATQLPPIDGVLDYLWDFGDGTVGSGQTVTHRYVQPGVKYPILIYKDPTKGCTRSKRDTLFIRGLPLVRLKSDTAVCQGTPVSLDAGVDNATYLWNTGETTRAILARTEGKYWVTITDPITQCISSDTTNIRYIAKPIIDATVINNRNCTQRDANGKIKLFVSGPGEPYTFAWRDEFNRPRGTADSVNLLDGGIFRVRVTNSLNCFVDTNFNVLNRPAKFDLVLQGLVDITQCGQLGEITVKAIPSERINENGDLIIDKPRVPFDSILWVNELGDRIFFAENYLPPALDMRNYVPGIGLDKGTADTVFFRLNNRPPGEYSLIIYDNETDNEGNIVGCPQKIGPFKINPPRPPLFDIGPDQVTCNPTATLRANVTGGIYTWSGPGIVSGQGSTQITANQTGKYVLSVLDIATNCVTKDSANITLHPTPTANLGPDIERCVNVPTLITVTTDIGNRFVWYESGLPNPVSNFRTLDVSSAVPSNRVWAIQVSDSVTNCRRYDTVRVIFNERPLVSSIPFKHLCEGDSFLVRGTAFGGAPNYTFNWSSNPVSSIGNINEFQIKPATGTYTYDLFVEDSKGCSSSTTRTTIRVTPRPIADAGTDLEFCVGNDSLLVGNATSGTGEYTFIWRSEDSGPDTTQTLFIRPDFTSVYRLTVLDSLLCDAYDSVEVIVNQLPNVRAFDPDTICRGDLFAFQAEAWAGAGSGYLFYWSSDNNTFVPQSTNASQIAFPLLDTRYIVRTRDGKGCESDTASVKVWVNFIPSIFAGPDTAICPGFEAQLKSFPTGGGLASTMGPIFYQFQWRSLGSDEITPDTIFNPIVKPDVTTNYIVRVSDGLCVSPFDTVEVLVHPPAIAVAGPDQIVCRDNSVNLSASGANGGTTIWFGGNNLVAIDSIATVVAEKDTLFWVQVIDRNGCKDLDTTLVSTFTTPDVNLNPITCLITGQTVGINGKPLNFEIPNATFTWFFNGDTTQIKFSMADSIFIASQVGEYVVRYGIDRCVVFDTTTASPNPTIFAGNDQVICRNDTAIQIANSPNDLVYVWKNLTGDTLGLDSVLTIRMLYDSTLIVMGTDIVGCQIADTAQIAVFTTPDVALNPILCFVPQNSYRLAARPLNFEIPNATYTWFFNGDTTQVKNSVTDSVFFPLAIGEYVVRYGLGNCVVFDTTLVTPNPTLNPVSDQIICRDDTAVFNVTSVNNLNFVWYNLTGDTLSLGVQLAIKATRDSILSVTGTDAFGCSISDTSQLQTFITPDIMLPTVLCFNPQNSFRLSARPLNFEIPNGEFVWRRNGTLISLPNVLSDSVYIATDTGTYTVVYGLGGCRVRDTTRISLSPLASNPTDTTICWFNSTPVRASTPTGVPPFRFIWEANPQLDAILGQQVIATPDTTVGLYQYFVTITDSLNCTSNRATANVRVVKPGKVQLSNPLACEGDTIQVSTTPNAGVNVTAYSWFRNGVLQNGNASQLDIFRSGSYKLIYVDGFCPDSSFIDVNFNPKPIPVNTPEYLFCKDTTVFDTTTIVLDAGPATRWLWDRGDTTQKIRVDRKGVYYFTLFNEFLCSIRDSAVLRDECPPRLFVPDAFTPNGDRNNDKFNVYYAYIKNFRMWIFNRWGEVIYYTEDPTQPWDGFYRDELMQPGTYPWMIQYDAAVDKFGKNFKKEGRVTVIR